MKLCHSHGVTYFWGHKSPQILYDPFYFILIVSKYSCSPLEWTVFSVLHFACYRIHMQSSKEKFASTYLILHLTP